MIAIQDLMGLRCLVTGGSSGIGAAVAQAFAEQGAIVGVHANRGVPAAKAVVAGITDAGGSAFAFQADLAERGAAHRLVEEAAQRLGGIDILINNAGSPLGRTHLADMSDAQFDAVLDTNLRSVFEVSRAAVPFLRAAGGGVIINTTSISARSGGGAGVTAYAMAKAGVSSITRGLAKELAMDRIRVNAVSPGIILTRIHAESTSTELMRQLVSAIPMQRAGTVDECTGTFLFLASSAMSGYITGQIIEVNGGQIMP